MGLIKKLKGKELIGWSLDPNTEVYPITSTSAIYDSNNNDLNSIIEDLKKKILAISTSLESSGTGSSTTVINNTAIEYYWAFKGAKDDTTAKANLNLNSIYNPPTGWSSSSNVSLSDNLTLYMTTARKKGDNWLSWNEDGNSVIWSTPIRIGAAANTSNIGNDDGDYNYIYCRRTIEELPGHAGITVSKVEEASKSNKGVSISGDNSTQDISDNIYDYWTDHPLGVTKSIPFEYLSIYKYNSEAAGDKWVYVNTVLWSRYGQDGKDGDGLEYIYKLYKAGDEIEYWSDTITGGIGEESPKNITINITDIDTDVTYQTDDFIPAGWHDEPLDMTDEYPLLYVSIRKKNYSSGLENPTWGMFSYPTLWSLKVISKYSISLDNDAIVLDDNTSTKGLLSLSKCDIHIYKEGLDITTDDSYKIIIRPISDGGLDTFTNISSISSINNSTISLRPSITSGYYTNTDKQEYIISENLYNETLCGFSIINTLSLKEGVYSITYLALIYTNDEAPKLLDTVSKTLSILIVDINDGVSYGLLVFPNSFNVKRDSTNSDYYFLDTNEIIISAIQCSGETLSSGRLYNTSLGDIDYLFVEVLSYKDNLVTATNYAAYDSGNGGTSIIFKLNDAGNNVSKYKVNLKYISNGVEYLVDTETVDINYCGDDGISPYYLTMSNDSTILDELTISAESLRAATYNEFLVFSGQSNITSNCTFSLVSRTLPSGLSIQLSANTGTLIPNEEISNAIEEGRTYTLNEGVYNYVVLAKYNSLTVALKAFTFIVKNITADGTVFKLNITNDVWLYDGNDSSVLTTLNSIISVSAITNGSASEENFNFRLLSELTNSGLEVVYPSTLGGLLNASSRYITPSGTYRSNGYDLLLYYCGIRVDSEHINCIKNGTNGIDGVGAYQVSLDNDSATLDDNTIDAASIKIVTLTSLNFAIGTADYTKDSNVSYTVVNLEIPEQLELRASNNSKKVKGDSLTDNSFYLAPVTGISTITKGSYKVTIGVNYLGTLVASKSFTFTVADLNATGATYKLTISNDVWSYDGDTSTLLTGSSNSILTVSEIINGVPNDKAFSLVINTDSIVTAGSNNKAYLVLYNSLLSGNISNSDKTTSSLSKTITPLSSYNSNGFTFDLYYNGVKVDSEKIDCRKNGKQGPKGDTTIIEGAKGLAAAILVPAGVWTPKVYYCYNTDRYGESETSARYIDVVTFGADSYMCKESHTASDDFDSSKWLKMTNLGLIATKSILAEAIATNSLNATDIVITKSDGSGNIVAGMTSADPSDTANGLGVYSEQLDTANNGGIRIWAGSKTNPSSGSSIPISLAPFRVYEDGTIKTGYNNGTVNTWSPDGTLSLSKGVNVISPDGRFSFGNGLFRLEDTINFTDWKQTNVIIGNDIYNGITLGCDTSRSSTSYRIALEDSNGKTNNLSGSMVDLIVDNHNAYLRIEGKGDKVNDKYPKGAIEMRVDGTTSSRALINVYLEDWNSAPTTNMVAYHITPTGAGSASDITIKENFKDIVVPLNDIANSPLFEFNFIGSDEKHVGTSALYWEPILPTTVKRFYTDNDKDGKLSVDYANLSYILVASLAKEVNELKKIVLELQSKLDSYE